MLLVLNRKGTQYCILHRALIRMDRLVITLSDFAYTLENAEGEPEVSLERVHSRCAANALVRAGYLKRTDRGYAVLDRNAFHELRRELFEKANKMIDKPMEKGGK